METATLEDIIQRLDRLEKIVTRINEQLSWVVEEAKPDVPKEREARAALRATEAIKNDKKDAHIAKEALAKIYKKMGVPPDFKLRPLKDVRKSMVESGIRPEDNEFSRAIIAEREK